MISVLFLGSILLSAQGQEKPVPQLQQWEQDVRLRIAKDDKLKPLAAKYPLVLLHSLRLYSDADQWAFSFINETSDSTKNSHPTRGYNDFQLRFNGGSEGNVFEGNMQGGHQHLVVDLGKVDFEKDPEPKRISIDANNVMRRTATAVDGHVYLERVRDDNGNNFYVVFQVVTVDPQSRYIAFLWRRLPGGKVVKPPEKAPKTSDG